MIESSKKFQSLTFLAPSEPFENSKSFQENIYQEFFKRVVDLFLFAICAPVILPILLFLMVLIKLDSKGPAIYRSLRIGKDGKKFFCLKLRTMCTDADLKLANLLSKDPELRREWEQDHKLKNDPRVTRVGKLIRAFSLDELPQVINVLRGEMSFVGPRPIVSEEIEKYKGNFQFYLRVRPGITGLWQVNGRNDITYDQRVQLDKKYSLNYNLKLDLNILVKTVPVILSKKGAY